MEFIDVYFGYRSKKKWGNPACIWLFYVCGEGGRIKNWSSRMQEVFTWVSLVQRFQHGVIWYCWIMALLPCWSWPGRPHAIHAPVSHRKLVAEEPMQGDAILCSTPVTRFLGLSSVISSMSKVILMYSRHLHLNCVKIMWLFCQSGSHSTGLDLVAALISTDIYRDWRSPAAWLTLMLYVAPEDIRN